ncbi:hypothetical protein PHYBOEH_008376 [Phytophthora boehmeriae]|uniref:Uncharacterized protein n=1 Tax=Phytophthora boehmeriae TaxID=109152 RepID=A0A8T1W4Q3_9STRA|nr:hypothetical protein PHYBOEH_008376 [Phytophthora boehmeriae]
MATSSASQHRDPEDHLELTSYNLKLIPEDVVAGWSSKGADAVDASYGDIEGIKKLLEGAEAVEFISPWLFGDGRRNQSKNVCRAAKEIGVKQKTVKECGLDFNIQRNWLYMDNIPTLFTPPWQFSGNKWLSSSHGVPDRIQVDMSDEELTKWWLDRSLPTDVATGDFPQLPMKLCIGDAICCGTELGNGSMQNTSDTVEKLTGRKPARYQDYLLKYKDIFPKPVQMYSR